MFIRLVNVNRQHNPKLPKKIIELYQLLQMDTEFQRTRAHTDAIFDTNKNFAKAANFRYGSQ